MEIGVCFLYVGIIWEFRLSIFGLTRTFALRRSKANLRTFPSALLVPVWFASARGLGPTGQCPFPNAPQAKCLLFALRSKAYSAYDNSLHVACVQCERSHPSTTADSICLRPVWIGPGKKQELEWWPVIWAVTWCRSVTHISSPSHLLSW